MSPSSWMATAAGPRRAGCRARPVTTVAPKRSSHGTRARPSAAWAVSTVVRAAGSPASARATTPATSSAPGTAATMALLRRIPGAQVVEIDAGCCGMAGSFGFESEHYEMSMTIASDRLLPALAAEPENSVVAATGVSCRQQIFHGAGRTAWHPLELVREAMTG